MRKHYQFYVHVNEIYVHINELYAQTDKLYVRIDEFNVHTNRTNVHIADVDERCDGKRPSVGARIRQTTP